MLLPRPREATAHKGFFATDKGVKIENGVGADAQNAFVPAWADGSQQSDARHVAIYRRLEGETSPEAYRLHVAADTLLISAAGAEGFMRAWQTIAQLTTRRGVPCVDIIDSPTYRWRGLMLDVTRHFFPISFLKKQVDVMARYKMNRLQLHLTDAEGWRMQIKRYPRLTDSVAWRPYENLTQWDKNGRRYCSSSAPGAYGGYYTQDELRDFVAYAAQRGITVVPEIEMPGHSGAVLAALPELSCTHQPREQSDYCAGSVATFDFIENVLREVMDVFPSHYIHVGGDEAAKKSWPTCPLCQMRMREEGIADVDGLQAYFITRIGKFLNAHGRQLVGWDEVTAGNLSPNTTVMVWRGTERAQDAISHGYDVVLSPGDYCYLDHYQDAPATQPAAISGYLSLEKVYSYVPGSDLSASDRSKVTGVQGNLWTEWVSTASHAEYMLWPRAMALAEIGWSGAEGKSQYTDFRSRALAETKWLNTHGVNTFDLTHEVGQRKEAVKPLAHKAVGKTITLNTPYMKSYPAGGNDALIDGLGGGWSYGDKRWQAFSGNSGMDATIDLGSAMSISSVESTFMQMCGPGVFVPSGYSVEVSLDGTNFTSVYNKSWTCEKSDNASYLTCRWSGHAKARYIRVKAAPTPFGGFIFCDEIIVK